MTSDSRRAAAGELSDGSVDWSNVFAEELPRVLNYMRYQVGDESLAEDLTASTFEKAWRARARYRRERAAFTTWLFTIARNVCTDYFRRRAARSEIGLRDVEVAIGSPEEQVERQDEFARLASLLERLPDRERELVALKYGAGMTNREAARLTALSESNVGTILHRVVMLLRRQLMEDDKHER